MPLPDPIFSGRNALASAGLGGGGSNSSDFLPSFDLTFIDAGNGVAQFAPQVGGVDGTFTNAAQGWTKLASGLWGAVANGKLRYFYSGLTTAAGTGLGGLFEGARTNSCLQARDLSNASWTKTTATGAKDQTGIDGSANSASSLLATAGNGTATQALTIASAAKTFSVWIKRITGTGTIQISLDNFATNTDVTSLINASTYTQVTMTQTLANPTVGIKIVTNGDKIAVDMAQLEDGASFASTPIPTTVAAVTRNADVLTYPIGSILNYGAAHTIVVRGQYFNVTGNGANWNVLAGSDVNYDGLLRASTGAANGSSDYFSDSGGSVGATLAGTDAARQNTTLTYIGRRNVNSTLDVFVNKVKGTTSAAAGAAGSPTLIEVGCHGSLLQLNGAISSFRIYPQALPDGVCQQF